MSTWNLGQSTRTAKAAYQQFLAQDWRERVTEAWRELAAECDATDLEDIAHAAHDYVHAAHEAAHPTGALDWQQYQQLNQARDEAYRRLESVLTPIGVSE